jgi:hypothetical protein
MAPHDYKVGRPLRASSQSTRNFTFRLAEDERAALDWHAEQADKPAAALVRDALEQLGLLKIPRGKR